MEKVRQSNIELLRIVITLGILCLHIMVHGMGIYEAPIEDFNWIYHYINNICLVGVNVFILISGYFSMKFSWNKLLRIYLMCASVAGLCYLWYCYRTDMSIGRNLIYNIVFAFSWSYLWFIIPYVCLFVLSPFINPALDLLSRSSYRKLILTLLFISCYFGWFWQNDVNKSGFCLMQFVTLYCIGNYIRKFNVHKIMRIPAWGGVILLFAAMQTMLIYYLLLIKGRIFPPLPAENAYNSPFLVIISIGSLCLFLNMNIRNNVINFLAKSTFGVYIIHCNQYLWDTWPNILRPIYTHSFFGIISSVLLLYVFCVIVDIIIRYACINPIHKGIIFLVNKIKNKI